MLPSDLLLLIGYYLEFDEIAAKRFVLPNYYAITDSLNSTSKYLKETFSITVPLVSLLETRTPTDWNLRYRLSRLLFEAFTLYRAMERCARDLEKLNQQYFEVISSDDNSRSFDVIPYIEGEKLPEEYEHWVEAFYPDRYYKLDYSIEPDRAFSYQHLLPVGNRAYCIVSFVSTPNLRIRLKFNEPPNRQQSLKKLRCLEYYGEVYWAITQEFGNWEKAQDEVIEDIRSLNFTIEDVELVRDKLDRINEEEPFGGYGNQEAAPLMTQGGEFFTVPVNEEDRKTYIFGIKIDI